MYKKKYACIYMYMYVHAYCVCEWLCDLASILYQTVTYMYMHVHMMCTHMYISSDHPNMLVTNL